MRIISTLLLSLSLLIATPAFSAWQLNNGKSSLTFVSIKKGTVAENHRFKTFSGNIDSKGVVSITIDLGSVDTKIAVRDGRMTEFLFETSTFAQARFSAQLNQHDIEAIAVGSSKRLSVSGNIDLHGQQQTLVLDVLVARLSEKVMIVTTLQPAIIKAQDFALVAGINKLQALAKLPSIAYAVPVSFTLTFINQSH
jgi:polyisoprenoid-binding protein YceI